MRRSCLPNSSSHQHGPPLLGRVRTPPRSPTSTLVCSPPTPSLPSVAAPVSPRQRPTPVRRACSSPLHRCPRRPVQRRRLFYPGSPCAGSLPKEKRGYPRCLGHPLRACRGPRPRRVQPPLARSRCGHHRLQVRQYPGHPEIAYFVAVPPAAHTLACLRFAESVTVSGARLATGPGGLTLGRAGFAPAG